jgi:adenylate cyclase
MAPRFLARNLLRSVRQSSRPEPPEAVEVTLLFCDVARSTELTERLGDVGAYTLICGYHDLVAGWAQSCRGEELEVRGDGVLIAFHEPRFALECAIGIQRGLADQPPEERLAVRIGLHTGRALRVALGYFGGTVILSARIADSAAPGQILASAGLMERLGEPRAVRLNGEQWLSLKGFGEPSQVFSVAWQPEAPPVPEAGAASPRRSALATPRRGSSTDSGMLRAASQAPV